MRSSAVAWVSAALGLALAAPAADAAPRYDVTVTRTTHGIAHVKAKDFASLGYGYAQALAEDTICTLADVYVTVDAERSRFFGPGGRVAFRGNGSTASNLNSDLFFQRTIDRGTVERLAAVPPPIGPKPEILRAVDGYVDGFNAWLRAQGGADGIDDPTCRGKAWVRPITRKTVLRRFYQLSLLASAGVAIDGIADAAPLTGAPDALGAARALAPGTVDERLGSLGSNAYGIGKDKSASGNGLLYGNPHFPWLGPERFFQSHLTIPGKLDVAGGSLLGVPIVLIGHTKRFAWSHTVSTARRFVPYELRLVPGDPTAYVVDGQTRRMRADRVTVQVRTADGKLEPRTRTLYSSHLGPMLTSILGLPIFPWTPERAYTLHDGNAENFGRLLNHFLDFNQVQSVDEAERVLDKYLGIPWVNTIAADSDGKALYADVGSVPGIGREQYGACQVALGVALDAAQRLPVLDGSRTSCEPQSAADAPVPGILGSSQLPRLRRSDHVSNMNDSHWLTNPAQPLEGFSRIIGDERTARSLRTRVGIDMLRRSGKLDLDGLAALGFENRVYSGELWRDRVVELATSLGLPDAAAALRGWDLRNDLGSKGAVLWQRFVTRLTGATPVALPFPAGPFSEPFDVNRPVDTPAGLNTANPTVAQALRQAVDDVRGAGLPLDAPLRDGQTVTRRGKVIPIQGGPGGSGIFNVITPVWDPAKGYTEVVHGTSYVQAVELAPGCPRARTLVTYGQSTNPQSPRTSDQTELFSAKRWVTPPFCAKDLEADRSAERLHTARTGALVATVREARGRRRPRITVLARAQGRTTVVVRRGSRVVRRLVRRGATVVVSPRVARGAYRVEVLRGSRRLTITAKQR